MRRKITKGWFLLPPALQEKIEAETPITSGLMRSAIDRILADPVKLAELRRRMDKIVTHLTTFPTGWGEWPQSDTESCLWLGAVLGSWLLRDLDDQIINFTEAQLEFLETECIEEGIELEDCLLEMFIESREPSDPF